MKVKTEGHTEEDGEVVAPTCMHFLVLQDLCNGLDNPCALDVKMGRVTVEPGEREVRTRRRSRRGRCAGFVERERSYEEGGEERKGGRGYGRQAQNPDPGRVG